MPKGPGRFALQSTKRFRNGRNLPTKNIQQATFKGHCNRSNNESEANELNKNLGRSRQSETRKPFRSQVNDGAQDKKGECNFEHHLKMAI